jgi:hypothetical protein
MDGRSGARALAAAALVLPWLLATAPAGAAEPAAAGVDIGLVLAVDVSGSVSPERYRLQMEGIAKSFEDREVARSILAGPHGAVYVALVEWSDKPHDSIPWTLLASAADARAFAEEVRRAPRIEGTFTCMSLALRFVADKILPFLPAPAERRVIDVSGDGHDNCNPKLPVDAIRDELVAREVTINGLPILEGEEADTLEGWYRQHVIGGSAAFLQPAKGFGDFARAMRQKFIAEIAGAPAPRQGGPPALAFAHINVVGRGAGPILH